MRPRTVIVTYVLAAAAAYLAFVLVSVALSDRGILVRLLAREVAQLEATAPIGEPCLMPGWTCVNVPVPASPPDVVAGHVRAWIHGGPNGQPLAVWRRGRGVGARSQLATIVLEGLAATIDWVRGLTLLVAGTLGFAAAGLWYAAGALPWRRRVERLERALERLGRDEQVPPGGEAQEPLEAALQAALLRLRETSASLNDAERLATLGYFAGGVAHQIGNPLAAARQYLEAVAAAPAGAVGAAALERARVQLDRIHRAVEGLLRFARPERLHRDDIALAPFLERLAADQREQWRRPCDIRVTAPADLHIITDALALEQVLLNLLRNALEAQGESPRIDVVAAAVAGDVAIALRDDGPGFPPDWRPDAALRSVKHGGTGLGLPLAGRLAALLGGRLTYANAAGGGALVTVWLPAAAGAGAVQS